MEKFIGSRQSYADVAHALVWKKRKRIGLSIAVCVSTLFVFMTCKMAKDPEPAYSCALSFLLVFACIWQAYKCGCRRCVRGGVNRFWKKVRGDVIELEVDENGGVKRTSVNDETGEQVSFRMSRNEIELEMIGKNAVLFSKDEKSMRVIWFVADIEFSVRLNEKLNTKGIGYGNGDK